MPDNRTARLAVLGSSASRPASASYSSRTRNALTRRIVMGVLVALSLLLVTVYVRESESGGLHGAQAAGASVLRPFEVGVQRLVRPFRDLYGYGSGLVHARSEAERLRLENRRLRQQAIRNESAVQDLAAMRRDLGYRGAAVWPRDFQRPVNAEVLGGRPSRYEQQVVVAAGSSSGIRKNDAVMTRDGLVGRISLVTPDTARVTLLTDPDSAVGVVDQTTGARGILRHGQGDETLGLDFVSKKAKVSEGDVIVTAASQSGELPLTYPKDIPVGQVTSATASDTDLYWQVQVQPFVDFSSLESVSVLRPKRPRPQLP